MKIRYQNGTAVEALTLFRTEAMMRVAVVGREDVMELTRIHGVWITDDCEPVTMETAIEYQNAGSESDDDFICPRELAEHLVSLLFIDTGEDDLDGQSFSGLARPGVSTLLA